MKINILVLIIFAIIIQSCDNNDCGACFTPPQNFEFEIIHKAIGENLFTNETFDFNKITITDSSNNNESVDFSFISENN